MFGQTRSLALISILIGCISSTVVADIRWFGETGLQCLSIPMVDKASDQLVSMLAKIGSSESSEIDDTTFDDIADCVANGFSPNDLIQTFGSIKLSDNMSPTTTGLGGNQTRAQFYTAMIKRASDLHATNPDKSARLLRCAAALSLLDFRAVARPAWIGLFSDASVIARMKLSEDEAATFQTLTDSIRADSAATPMMVQFVRASESLFDLKNVEIEPEKLEDSLRIARGIWDRASSDLITRWTIAGQVWKLKCLAKSRNDEANLNTIRDCAQSMEKAAVDPVSKRWAREIMELDGPAPKGSGIKVLKPEDLRPKAPR